VTEIDSWTRAALRLLHTRGVAEFDLIPALRVGLIVHVAMEDTPAMRRLRARLRRSPPRGRPDPAFARRLAAIRSHQHVVEALWEELEERGADNPVGAIWRALDRCEGELLVGGTPSWIACP
jgi:hypothetical protein